MIELNLTNDEAIAINNVVESLVTLSASLLTEQQKQELIESLLKDSRLTSANQKISTELDNLYQAQQRVINSGTCRGEI